MNITPAFFLLNKVMVLINQKLKKEKTNKSEAVRISFALQAFAKSSF